MDTQTRTRFAADVAKLLCASYMLDDGTVIKGQSYTHLVSCLRDMRWRLPNYCDMVEALEKAGFKVIRARTMRYTRRGELKPYAKCDCVTTR